MARRCSRVLLSAILSIAAFTTTATDLHAAPGDTETVIDARLEGYPSKVATEGSTAVMWMLLMLLGIITLAVLFKDAQRSHLD
ncbi:MAG TPA: hypothetical protein VGN72_04360 [Tepidisphaeraceae bacterium]|nr:hypothetical protein [Tepidisphaeraceae bacterium]